MDDVTVSSRLLVAFLTAASLLAPASGQLDESSTKAWENPCGTLKADMQPRQVKHFHLPWVVKIGFESFGRMEFDCVGSVIDRFHVLTAAHCVQPGKLPTRIQIRNCEESRRCEGPPRNYGVAKVVPHPEYSSLSNAHLHDVAVIRLDRDIDLAIGNMSSVCMPLNKLRPTSLDEEELVLAGWRIHKKGEVVTGSLVSGTRVSAGNGPLRVLTVPLVKTARCEKLYKDVFSIDPKLQLCAGGAGIEPCKGDAGAPLHALVGKRVVQVGLVSFGMPDCSNSSLPTVYTNVKAYARWIQQTVADL